MYYSSDPETEKILFRIHAKKKTIVWRVFGVTEHTHLGDNSTKRLILASAVNVF